MDGIAGRRALVTGAGRGIGRAVAARLARDGCAVALAGRGEGLEQAAEAIRADGGAAHACPLDVTDPDGIRRGVDAAVAALGGLDVLVNNAGVNVGGPLAELRVDDLDRMLDVNVRGPLLVLQAATGPLTASGRGRVVNIGSWVGRTPAASFVAYSATKAALLSLTRGAALELAPAGITVNAVCPGNVWSDIWTSATATLRAGSGETPRTIFEASVAAQPIPRGVEPEEVAAAVAYLVGDDARSITGEAIYLASGL
jgi:meso-butanediol dehydrogenase/(S,S)-butanediol dehydrogenase/diacetyl reductase